MKAKSQDISRYLLRAGATQFLSRKQLVDWQYDLDERLLRATGSPRHEAYIDVLHERLARAGVKQLRFEPVSLRQWSVEAEHWGLEVLDGERPGVLPSAGYIPYSGVTPASGITGRIVYLAPNAKPDASLAGKLVLVEMPEVTWTGQVFHQTGRARPRPGARHGAGHAVCASVPDAWGVDFAAGRPAGQTFRAAQRPPTINYAKAPTYQFSYGIGTVTQVDYRLMQRETVALTQMLLDLSRVPYADLRKQTAP